MRRGGECGGDDRGGDRSDDSTCLQLRPPLVSVVPILSLGPVEVLDILLGSFSPLQNLLRELVVISAHRSDFFFGARLVLGLVSFEVLPSTCRHTAAWLTVYIGLVGSGRDLPHEERLILSRACDKGECLPFFIHPL